MAENSMSIIKFRARVKNNGKPWLFYQHNQYLVSFLRRATSFIAWQKDDEQGRHESYLPEALENYLDRFTGLFDREKQEIYEGDIVLFDDTESEYVDVGIGAGGIKVAETSINGLGKVIFENGTFGIWVEGDTETLKKGFNSFQNDIETSEIEVVGNIYENPEML